MILKIERALFSLVDTGEGVSDETREVPGGLRGDEIKAIRKTDREQKLNEPRRGDISDMSFAVNHSRRLARSVALCSEPDGVSL